MSLAALAAGGLLPLSLAPFQLWPLLLISAATLFWILARTPTGRIAFWRGWLYGVGKYGVGASWVYVSIHVYGPSPPWLAALLTAAFVLGMAVFNGVLGWGFHLLRSANKGSANKGAIGDAVVFTVLWTALEWLLTWFMTGFPWLFAGYAFIDTPLAGLAPIGGVLLVSFAAVLTASLVVVAPKKPLVLAVPAAAWLVAWGLGSVAWTERGETRTVALAQGNIPQSTKWTPNGLSLSRKRYGELTSKAHGADIVVWPEAAIPDFLRRHADFIEAQRHASTDIVTGVFVGESTAGSAVSYYNAAMSTGGGVYRKRHLVPFGDYVPLQSALRGLVAFFDLPMSGTSPGADGQPLLRAAGIDLAMAICWEIAYPKTVAKDARDAGALVTISNDTWFGDSIGPSQHLQIARMRALENGRYLLRSTNDGITAIVDDRGEVLDRLRRFQAGVLTGTIHAVSGTTPFTRWLNWPVLVLLAACGVGVLAVPRRW